MPNTKSLPARVKAANDGGDGVVEALVATYDVDSIGDRIVPGAFTKSLGEWEQRAADGERIPFIWSHMHDDLDAYLGDVLEAKETDEGLWVKAQIDMEDDKARKAFRLLKGGRVRNYSFAYEVVDAGPDEDGDGETALKELRLFEVGPTLIGMNQNTRTLVAKRDGVQQKVGRVISASNETSLREAYDAIGRVLAQLGSDEDEDEPKQQQQDDDRQPEEPEKADERTRVKADEPMPAGAMDDDLLLEIQLLEEEA